MTNAEDPRVLAVERILSQWMWARVRANEAIIAGTDPNQELTFTDVARKIVEELDA